MDSAAFPRLIRKFLGPKLLGQIVYRVDIGTTLALSKSKGACNPVRSTRGIHDRIVEFTENSIRIGRRQVGSHQSSFPLTLPAAGNGLPSTRAQRYCYVLSVNRERDVVAMFSEVNGIGDCQ